MNDTLSWTLSGFIAGLALLSLSATGAEPVKKPTAPLQLAMAESMPGRPFSTILADAYFDLARGEAQTDGFDDWYVRHQITVKGIAAQRGEALLPEDPGVHSLKPKDREALAAAQRSLTEWQAYVDRGDARAGNAVLPLLAALKARYDWWLLNAEAGAPHAAIAAAALRFGDLRAALLTAINQSRIATL